MAQRTALRRDAVDILTPLGWLNGTLHVPAHLGLREHLSVGVQDLKVTGVCVVGEPERLRFLALRRSAATVVAPALAEEAEPLPDYMREREVACLLSTGILRGTLRVHASLRLSDHLSLEGPWLTMRHCLLVPYGGTANSPGARSLHTAITNLAQVLGVSEAP